MTDPAGILGVVRFAYEAGQLKRSRRTGWWRAGIRDPESVAEHSWRTAVLAWVIAAAQGADPERAATIGVFHDLAEARTGDIEYVGHHYVTGASAGAASALGSEEETFTYRAGRWLFRPSDLSVYRHHRVAEIVAELKAQNLCN